jgi:uncharacterized membrane protein YqjE
MDERARAGGVFASALRVLATLVELIQVRFELLATELEVQKHQLVGAALFGCLALISFAIGSLLACVFVVLALEPERRLAAVGVLALVYLGGAAWALGRARARLADARGIFAASLAELARDRAALVPGAAGSGTTAPADEGAR